MVNNAANYEDGDVYFIPNNLRKENLIEFSSLILT